MFSPGTTVSSTSRPDRHDITEILLKVALNAINQPMLFHAIFDTFSMVFNVNPWTLKSLGFQLYQTKSVIHTDVLIKIQLWF